MCAFSFVLISPVEPHTFENYVLTNLEEFVEFLQGAVVCHSVGIGSVCGVYNGLPVCRGSTEAY